MNSERRRAYIALREKLIIIIIGAFGIFSCKPDKITLPKEDLSSIPFRTDGYYYQLRPDTTIFQVVFFYSNGVLFKGGFANDTYLQSVDSIIRQTAGEPGARSSSFNWGRWTFSGSEIRIEKVAAAAGFPVYTDVAIINNDTTLTHFHSHRSKNNKGADFFNYILRFHKFTPKPDSTNSFVD